MTITLSRTSSAKYVPILKAKAGELKALSLTDSHNLIPLLEVIDPEGFPKKLKKAWKSTDREVWIQILDFPDIDPIDVPEAIETFFNSLSQDLSIIPVLLPIEEPDILAAYSRLENIKRTGVVLRIDVEDLITESYEASQDLETTLEQLSLTSSNCDLVVDAGLLSDTPEIQAAVVKQALDSLNVMGWRSIVVAFSAFPAAVGEIAPKSAVTTLPRKDAVAYKIVTRKTDIPLTYSDYGIGVPTYDGAPFAPIPSLKYAASTDWKIHRGEKRGATEKQLRTLANDIVNAPYFSGAHYSPADKMINDIASSSSGPGNPTTHVAIGMCRHFHVVLDRLATLGEP